MKLIELIILGIFDAIEYMILSNKLIKDNKKINRIKQIVFILITGIIVGIGRDYLKPSYNFLIAGFLISCMNYYFYEKDVLEAIYAYILSTIIIISIQSFSIVILRLFVGNVELSFFYAIVSQFISLTIIIIISIYIPINLVFEYIIEDNKVFKGLILNLFVLLLSILLYWYIDIEGILKNIIVMATFSLGAMYVNFIILKDSLKSEYEKKQLQIYEDYIPIIDELINEIRVKQHEFDNHIQALNMIAVTSTDYEDIVHSMENYINDIEINENLGDLIKLDNKILAGFLYSKVKKAKELGIDFWIDIKDYGFKLKLKDYELIEIIGNLINNAFETGVENNIVILKLKKEKDMNVIEIKNKHPYLSVESINKLFNKGYSTKINSKRGYGLYNIRGIVQKYNGNIEVFNKKFEGENFLVFKVLFNGD